MLNESKLKRLAESRLEHVLIALRDGDCAYNVRDVLDPWWCFERGDPFVTKRADGGYGDQQFNKPCAWKFREVLPKFDWMSSEAETIRNKGIEAKIVDRKNHPKALTLIVDHSVPLAVICKHLWRTPERWTVESLRQFLQQNFRRAVISVRENDLLDAKGLKSRMPEGWRVGTDLFARYRAVAIRPAFGFPEP